jgi:zinc metalloprotease ZmpB
MAETIVRNEYGEVVFVQAPAPSILESAATLSTPQGAAEHYLKSLQADLGLQATRLAGDPAREAAVDVPVAEFQSEKDIAGTKVVVYQQSVLGLEVFGARLGMQINGDSLALESVQSSMHATVKVENPDARAEDGPAKVSRAALAKLLGFELPDMDSARINRQVVLRYEPDQREEAHDHEGCLGGPGVKLPHLPKPKLKGLKKGQHYICNELLFRAAMAKGEPQVNWRALVEPKSGEVLYIRALVACATGLVFDRDPQTQTGAAVTASATNAVLNPFRSAVTLAGLTAATPQTLSGNYVRIAERSNPVQGAPTVPMPSGAFAFDAQTEAFNAVNAYHHCDALFRTMEDFGFNVPGYFNGTSFPVPVDFRALGDGINARAPGNATGTGLEELLFGKLTSGQTIGIATDNRVVWHEFGHALLWDHVNSPNFGFAHSAGDSLAVILNDPGSAAADRFLTFPWTTASSGITRRHDRAIADGWAWFGPEYDTNYRGEQILSTTLFRFYRAIGGDAAELATRRRAAEVSAFLIFKAIGLLTAMTPVPEVFVGHLQTADRTTPAFKGIPGGALHKVIRWAFEKQGLFQPAAAPGLPLTVNREGNPPEVDVYIDDGRHGEYTYQPNHWSCADMWVRRRPDGGLTHQNPLVGFKSYMYVRVKNRGLQPAQNVRVDAYHAFPGTGLAFPDDWMAMDTATLSAPGPLAPGASVILGPFKFVPSVVGHECLMAISHADGDPGNDTTIQGTIPEHRFVPFDNNIGQRNITPVRPTLRDILDLLGKHLIWVRNPYKRPVVVRIEVTLPKFLQKLGWKLAIKSAGGGKFELGPRDQRKVLFVLSPGKDIPSDVLKRAITRRDDTIQIRSLIDGEVSGGMSYQLSFGKDDDDDPGEPDDDTFGEPHKAPPQTPGRPIRIGKPRIDDILKILRGEGDDPGPRGVRTLRLELDFDDD